MSRCPLGVWVRAQLFPSQGKSHRELGFHHAHRPGDSESNLKPPSPSWSAWGTASPSQSSGEARGPDAPEMRGCAPSRSGPRVCLSCLARTARPPTSDLRPPGSMYTGLSRVTLHIAQAVPGLSLCSPGCPPSLSKYPRVSTAFAFVQNLHTLSVSVEFLCKGLPHHLSECLLFCIDNRCEKILSH